MYIHIDVDMCLVSTHSRPKAAGYRLSLPTSFGWGFNTQPPEGGWIYNEAIKLNVNGFNTQPPEGGWEAV